jgi:hypothetical protein
MSNLEINITVDRESLGNDENWSCVGRFCELLQEAVSNEFPRANVSVSPERSSINGGRVEIDGDWDGYASEDVVRSVVKHWSESIYSGGDWLDDEA